MPSRQDSSFLDKTGNMIVCEREKGLGGNTVGAFHRQIYLHPAAKTDQSSRVRKDLGKIRRVSITRSIVRSLARLTSGSNIATSHKK